MGTEYIKTMKNTGDFKFRKHLAGGCIRAGIAVVLAVSVSACTMVHRDSFTGATSAQRDVRSYESSIQLAEASIEGGDYNTALHIYRRLAAGHPDDAELNRALGNALLAAGALDEAEQTYRMVAERNPDSLEAMVGLGRVYLAKSDGRNSIKAFNEALKIDPVSYVARNGLAVALDHLGKHNDAQKIYRKLLLTRPSDLMIKSNLGLSLTMSQRYYKAITLLTNVVTDPTAPAEARHNLALAYGLAGRSEVASELELISSSHSDVRGNLQYYELMRSALK